MSSAETGQNPPTQEAELSGNSFASYERFCNENNRSARKTGVLSAEVYQEIMNDSSTLFAESGLQKLPVLVDMRYGAGFGYDEVRARELAWPNREVAVLGVPIGDLNEVVQAKAIETIVQSGHRAIFFADNDGRDAKVLYKGLREQGMNFIEKPLHDERSHPGYEAASLSLYSVDAIPEKLLDNEHGRKKLQDVQAHFDQFTYPTILDPKNASLLRPGNTFSDAELDEVWALYSDRFQYLGLQHPISMEDSKEDFLALFTNPDVTVSIKYIDGKPICFTYFMENLENIYWLNTSYLLADYTTADRPLIPVFFPGIVASKDSRGYNAHEVIGLFAQEVAYVGMGCRIYFENTNFSEQYIPKMVYRAAVGLTDYAISLPKKLDQTDYKLIELLPPG